MKKLMIFGLLLLTTPWMMAQDEEFTQQMSITLDDAINYAFKQNRSLQNASLEVKKAHAQRWQTIASMLPQADGNAQYTNMCGYEMNFSGMKMAMPPYIQHSVSASIAINGQLIVGALLNNLAIEMQDITRQQSEANLRANVIQSYLSILVMQEVVALMDSDLVNLNQMAQHTQNMVDVGAAEQTDADKIMVQVNSFRNTVRSYERNLRLSYDALRVLLDVGGDTQLILLDPIENQLSADKAGEVLMQDFDINRNYNYQLLEKNVDLAKKNVILAGMAYLPTLSAAYQFTSKKYFSDEATFNMQPPHTVVATVSIPLWSSGKRAAAITEKKIALQEAENTFSETADNLNIQLRQLRFNLSNAYETFITEQENIAVNQRIFEKMTNKYEWGAASSLELTQASNDLISAEMSYTNAALSLINAQVELEKFLNN
ncbi:MAG: TolC family protein [Paludibacteraceae bacterium]|nr:TolC family protein [Paludibacteraceae bacterium]